ncbi:MAG TPA: hypothetical protein VGR30_09625 [Candidatus Binatia bacterium]|jgi:hypothetical protein|nr:hypothetical protein [Candidatus Binatia bacterium]
MEAADVGNQQVPAGPDHGSKKLKGSAQVTLKALAHRLRRKPTR